ncbi:MAG TPA: M4 family metallopeptidase, partial [Phototrophicaceae bacterium]|nr:M4 family metallopeptidase [Phototrophicaceae bacterium]
MNQKLRNFLIVMVLLMLSTVILGATTVSAKAAQRVGYNPGTGKVSFIGASVANPLIVAEAVVPGLSKAARAQAILNAYAPQFGASAQNLTFISQVITRDGRISRRYQQTYQGLQVVGAQLIVNMTKAGGLVSMVGKASPDLAIGVSPVLSAAQAQQLAIQNAAKVYGVNASTLSASAATLAVYDARLTRVTTQGAALVYQVTVTSTVGAPLKVATLVNAVNGRIAQAYNNIQSFNKIGMNQSGQAGALALPGSGVVSRVPGTADLATYDTDNSTSLPGTFLCDETDLTCTDGADTDADVAHVMANDVYNMYWDWHGRDSLDGLGMQLISTVHFDIDYCNAGWTGDQMIYGDGCPSSIVLDDVVGHELTHGVTEFTSGLIYQDQSGAMNESFSDVWGEFFDLTNGTVEDTPDNRWRIGEEIDFGTPGGGIRDMQDPT